MTCMVPFLMITVGDFSMTIYRLGEKMEQYLARIFPSLLIQAGTMLYAKSWKKGKMCSFYLGKAAKTIYFCYRKVAK